MQSLLFFVLVSALPCGSALLLNEHLSYSRYAFDVFCLLIGHGCSASLSLCFISVDVGWQLKYTG